MVRAVVVLVLCLILQFPATCVHAGDIDVVRTLVHKWAWAWESKDIDRYMSFYAPVFQSNGLDYQGWKKQKSRVFKKSAAIKVEISDLWVFIEKHHANVSFVQRHWAQNVQSVVENTLILEKNNGAWKIVSENWKPLTTPVKATTQKKSARLVGKFNKSKPKRLEPEHKPEIENPLAAKPVQPPDKQAGVRNQQMYQPKKTEVQHYPKKKNFVKSLNFQIKKNSEKVFLSLNQFTIPSILTLAGDRPRIVIDIHNVSVWKGPSKIAVNGKLIRQIRTHLHRRAEKLRVVLDLNPADDYFIDQTFDKKENIYYIEVR